jgi:hypothetical protein
MDSTMIFRDPQVWARVDKESEEIEFSDDDSYDFQYSKGSRTKPTEGRNANGQWQDKEVKRRKAREAKAKKREEERAAKIAAGVDLSDEGEVGPSPGEGGGGDDEDEGEEEEEEEKKPAADVWGGAGNVIVRLGRDLFKAGCLEVKPLPKARVPVVKFKDPESGMSCDVCLNNMLATENTRLLYVVFFSFGFFYGLFDVHVDGSIGNLP